MGHGKFRSFFTGALVGAGLGILLAPKEGSETRNDLRKSFSLLVDTIKNVDIEETKAILLNKVSEIRDELLDIDSATAQDLAKEKVDIVTTKCDELIETAAENNVPIVEKAALSVKENAVNMLDEFLEEIGCSDDALESSVSQKKKAVSSNKKASSKNQKSKTMKKTTTKPKGTKK